jgi:hypothetical protein
MAEVLHLILHERARQIAAYGTNSDNLLGFGGIFNPTPWLVPYSSASATEIEAGFREDYEIYETLAGKPTWMHLIREEVAEMFAATDPDQIVDEAVQVAALCVSLVEHLLENEGDVQ